MTTTNASDGRVARPNQPIAAWLVSPLRAPGRLWLRGALLLAGAAQLITISALTSADPEPARWAMLLLAVAPALLAGAAVFAPAPVKLAAVVVAGAAMVAGLVGAATYTGFFFAPAVAALAVGGVKLWRERS
jgi:hypothetical protein